MPPVRPVATPFETDRLRLRELVHDDAAFVLEMVNDPAWLANVGDRRVRSLDDACRYVDRVREGSYERHGFGLWLVEPRAGGEPVGMAGMVQRVVLPCPDVGFAFLERHRGQGYAREAVAGTLRVASEVFGVTHVAAIVGAAHAPSRRVVEGNGFVYQTDFRWANRRWRNGMPPGHGSGARTAGVLSGEARIPYTPPLASSSRPPITHGGPFHVERSPFMGLVQKIENTQLKTDRPDLRPGYTIEVMVRVIEGDKERQQKFRGLVTNVRGSGMSKTFTVRKISEGIGVERTFPLHSPTLASISVIANEQKKVRRAKLFYLRKKKGKAARLKDRATAATNA